jgi:uncharacterized protein
MAKVRRLVLDVVIPNASDLVRLTQDLADLSSISGASCFVTEFDKNVISIKIILEGIDLQMKEVEDTIQSHGGSIHSVDSVAAGKEIIEDVETPQD